MTRLGIVKVEPADSKNRRYAYLGCAVVAAALPGVDPVSMLLETAPLIALYELSIVLARVFGEPERDPAQRAGGREALARHRPPWGAFIPHSLDLLHQRRVDDPVAERLDQRHVCRRRTGRAA